jgi:hypothetical protein
MLLSCTSDAEKKEQLVNLISKNVCDNLSSKSSEKFNQNRYGNQADYELAIALMQLLNVPIKDFCECFTGIISRELLNKFSYSELLEIQKDMIKQLMVAYKILEQREIQVGIENCVKESLNNAGEDYQNFKNSLDDKYRK